MYDDYDILPVGKFEAIPVTSSVEPIPDNFPNWIKLDIQVDVDRLRQEYLEYPKNRSKHYFREMAKHLPKDRVKETVKIFTENGFGIDDYIVYPLRVIGTNKLTDYVGSYTKQLLENIGVPLFRQQYVFATKTWETKIHTDHPNFATHGYRMFIPIDPAYMVVNGENVEMTPGWAYYVNVARPHKGFTKGDRVVIVASMASDRLVQEAMRKYA